KKSKTKTSKTTPIVERRLHSVPLATMRTSTKSGRNIAPPRRYESEFNSETRGNSMQNLKPLTGKRKRDIEDEPDEDSLLRSFLSVPVAESENAPAVLQWRHEQLPRTKAESERLDDH